MHVHAYTQPQPLPHHNGQSISMKPLLDHSLRGPCRGWTAWRCARSLIRLPTLRPSLTSLDTTASETRDAKDGSWIWRPQQPIAAKSVSLDRMDACKVTDKPIGTATSACLFSTSVDTTASETRNHKDGSFT